ncbi:MAG: hypothetical protein M3Y65_25035 [Pseudomonadota bacterium]|nr:hypothetical protein [Pseudomonadota bacterium]
MKINTYSLYNALAQVRTRPEWPTGDKLSQLAVIAARFWFLSQDNPDGTVTLSGPTLSAPLTLDRETATIRLLNEVCSAILADDASNAIFALAEPLLAPFTVNRKFLQRRAFAFRKAHRDYEACFATLTQPQPQLQGD